MFTAWIARLSASSRCLANGVRLLARREPALQGLSCRRFFVMPSTASFGLARMFPIAGEPHYDSVTIVRSLDAIFTPLSIEAPRFEYFESS